MDFGVWEFYFPDYGRGVLCASSNHRTVWPFLLHAFVLFHFGLHQRDSHRYKKMIPLVGYKWTQHDWFDVGPILWVSIQCILINDWRTPFFQIISYQNQEPTRPPFSYFITHTAKCQLQNPGMFTWYSWPFIVSVITMMSFALIRLWIYSFPSLSSIPLIFHVNIRISFNLIQVVSCDVIFLPAGTARPQVSRSATYLWAIVHCFTCLLIALANASRPVSEKCNPSLPKCDRKRLSKLMACILLDFVQMCLMKILIFSTLLFSDTSSNLIGNSLIMTWALLFSVCASRKSALIRWIHVATSSCGTLFDPPKRTMTSSSFGYNTGQTFLNALGLWPRTWNAACRDAFGLIRYEHPLTTHHGCTNNFDLSTFNAFFHCLSYYQQL